MTSIVTSHRLKESLAEALAARSEHSIPEFDTGTPAEKTLKLLDRLMHGETVCESVSCSLCPPPLKGRIFQAKVLAPFPLLS